MAAPSAEAKFRIIYGLVKVLSLIVGLAGSLYLLMALVGWLTDRLWLRLGVALIVALLAPLVVADRLIPKDDPARGRGIPTDVLALTWMGMALLAAWLGGDTLQKPFVREADRWAVGGMPAVAAWGYALAGVRAQWPEPAPAVAASGAASASASATLPALAPAASAQDASGPADAASGAEVPQDAAAVKDGGERTPAELFKQLSPSVVSIAVKQKGGAEGGGTGFLIDREGVIATNHHVVEDAAAIRVKFMTGEKFTSIELLDDEVSLDLALLKIDYAAADAGAKPEAEPLVLGDSDAAQVGERVISIGNPLGLEHTLTDGLVSARRVLENRQWIQMSAPVSPGNSGGPLFNMRGEVIGVTTAQLGFFARGQNLNLAIPVNVLKGAIKPTYPARRRVGDDSSPTHW
jgi:serine protease Do